MSLAILCLIFSVIISLTSPITSLPPILHVSGHNAKDAKNNDITVFSTHSVVKVHEGRYLLVTEHKIYESRENMHESCLSDASKASPQCWRELNEQMMGTLLPLPQYTHLNSSEGLTMLARAANPLTLPLVMNFATQFTQTWCNIACLTNILNALSNHVSLPVAGEYVPYEFATQRALYENLNMPNQAACVKKILDIDTLTLIGATLEQLYGMVQCYIPQQASNTSSVRFDISMHFAEESSPAAFQKDLQTHLASKSLVIINFSRVHLSEMGGGHFSVLALYDEETDTALLADTARYKYPMAFVPVEDLFNAMNSTDVTSGRSRGWITISQVEEQ